MKAQRIRGAGGRSTADPINIWTYRMFKAGEMMTTAAQSRQPTPR